MNKLVVLFSILASASLYAGQSQTIVFPKNARVARPAGARVFELSSAKVEKLSRTEQGFSKITADGFETLKVEGQPEVPVKSLILIGRPEDIKVSVSVQDTYELSNTRPAPAQPSKCRCADDRKVEFKYNTRSYTEKRADYDLTYLGAFRGTPITRLDVPLAQYNGENNSVTFNTVVAVDTQAADFSLAPNKYTDYLIIAPEALVAGLDDFTAWKKSLGYNIIVEAIAAPVTIEKVKALVDKHYKADGTDFVILVGDETAIPMHKVKTSSSSATPSDLPYYTMDGATDNVPDLFYGRVIATSAADLRARLGKGIEFEKKSATNLSGLKKVIGIASGQQGSGLSDDEYAKSIEDKFAEVLHTESTHLGENDSVNSNPAVLNENLDKGALWIAYFGHGDGYSWPSMNQAYGTTHVAALRNEPSVKPVIIDVACQNGRVLPTRLGSTFVNAKGTATGLPIGAAAFYGGTVNISWDPPAIMSQGIAFEHLTKNFRHLGEALLAGQLYLASHWTNNAEVVENFKWYSLQGDPGLNINF